MAIIIFDSSTFITKPSFSSLSYPKEGHPPFQRPCSALYFNTSIVLSDVCSLSNCAKVTIILITALPIAEDVSKFSWIDIKLILCSSKKLIVFSKSINERDNLSIFLTTMVSILPSSQSLIIFLNCGLLVFFADLPSSR
ncbi:MAG: hypothetical protein P9M13_06250 [Candidatus Ancaeobacter aquaticus]|nr:hypothetical protein [Candidatus Ancaeobacter aquaticus]